MSWGGGGGEDDVLSLSDGTTKCVGWVGLRDCAMVGWEVDDFVFGGRV